MRKQILPGRLLLFVAACLFLLLACDGLSSGLLGDPNAAAMEKAATQTAQQLNLTPSVVPTNTPSPTITPSPTPAPALWVSSSLPAAFRDAFSPPPGWRSADSADTAMLRVEVGDGRPVASWVYALVVPFPTVVDGLTSEEFRQTWSGVPVGPFSLLPLLMDQNSLDVLSAQFGPPRPDAVRVVPTDQLVETAWLNLPSWAVVPFEAIEPRWKVLEVDGMSPLRRDFTPAAYPLTVTISLDGDSALAEQAAASASFPAANRDPAKLTTLAMTGVTALVRATAWLMEQRDILYPAQDIGPILLSADITHVSNEVPFARDCPYPDPSPGMRPFCSDPRYIDLLESIGTNVVELTGNHMQDWGSEAMLFTLDLYRQRGWSYFGGGANLAEARQALTLEHNGNRLAFLGCNAVTNDPSWATEGTPGSAPCDMEYFQAEIRRLREANYLPVMTFQYYESYQVEPIVDQAEDFFSMADAGAVIVSGSQAHFPQTFSIRNGSMIHFGLGNLFFDQYNVMTGTRNAFIDRHVFYAGRYLGTELITIVFEDNARARMMTPAEREAFLLAVFSASSW